MNLLSLSFSKQFVQTRSTAYCLNLMGALFAEHLPQTTLPHVRQWCFLTNMVKSQLHSIHMVTLPSGTQGGASSPNSASCGVVGWHAMAPSANLSFLCLYSSWALLMASIHSFLSAVVLEMQEIKFNWGYLNKMRCKYMTATFAATGLNKRWRVKRCILKSPPGSWPTASASAWS